jgi:hypothetical protein
MRTFIVVFVLALITIAFEVYSDAALTSGNIAPHAAQDPTALAVVHGLKRMIAAPPMTNKTMAVIT